MKLAEMNLRAANGPGVPDRERFDGWAGRAGRGAVQLPNSMVGRRLAGSQDNCRETRQHPGQAEKRGRVQQPAERGGYAAGSKRNPDLNPPGFRSVPCFTPDPEAHRL